MKCGGMATSTTLSAERPRNYIIPPVMAECSPVTDGVTQNVWTSLEVQSLSELHPSAVQ